jgi:toxin ParE1/3/4
MNQYRINALAAQDLDHIAEYLANISMELSDRFLQDFDRKCQQIVSFPMSGKRYATLRPDLRGMSFRGYIIFYRILDNGIEIVLAAASAPISSIVCLSRANASARLLMEVFKIAPIRAEICCRSSTVAFR